VPREKKSKDENARLKARIETLESELAASQPSLKEREGLLQSLLDNVLDGIITIDEKGIVRSFNRPAEDIFGYSASEVIGNKVEMLMPEPYRSEHDGYVSRYKTTGEGRIIGIGREVTGLHKDGFTFPMDLAVSEFQVDSERMFTGIVRNITYRKRLEEQLIQSAKLASLGELVGGIAHEINNPASIILMRAASLMREAKVENCPVDIQDDIEVIQRQCKKMAQITAGLLAFSRQSPFESKEAHVNPTIKSAIGLVENVMKSRGISLEVELSEGLPPIMVDTTRVEQVMLNLFNNAMDAMPEGGILRVSSSQVLESGTDAIRICVSDSGEGIAPEHLDRLKWGRGRGWDWRSAMVLLRSTVGESKWKARWAVGHRLRSFFQ
jgi:PAS domain S-box-containing protein